MNPTKKLPGASRISPSIIRKPDHAPQIKPVVTQLKTGMPAQSGKRPVAPPVYHPKQTPSFRGAVQQTVPRVLQTKSSQSRQAGQASRHPVAPPPYRPEAKKIVQPKTFSQPGKLPTAPPVYRPKIANSVRPVTAKTASPFSAVQMAQAEKGRKECAAVVVAKGGGRYEGEYKSSIHAEINALENYLSSGGGLKSITSIELSSKPCKYCHLILSDLGIRDKVQTADERDFGSCSGGSYGWFNPEGSVWNAIKKATGYNDVDAYIDTVIERQREL